MYLHLWEIEIKQCEQDDLKYIRPKSLFSIALKNELC